MSAGDNLLKAIVNLVFWLTVFMQKFYSVFHILGLLFILLIFSVAGGWVFEIVEAPIENREGETLKQQRIGAIDQFRTKVRNRESRSEVDLYVQEYEFVYINGIVKGIYMDEGSFKLLWTLTGAIYYCVTTYTLVGFGNLAPRTKLGKLLAIFYSGISIPVGTLVLGELGDFIVRGLKFLYLLLLRLCRCKKGQEKKESEKKAADEKADQKRKKKKGKEDDDKKKSKKKKADKKGAGKGKKDKKKSVKGKKDKKKPGKKKDDKKKSGKKKDDKKKSGKKKGDKKKGEKKKPGKKKNDKKKPDKKKSKKKDSGKKGNKGKSKKNKSRNNKGDDSYESDQDSLQLRAAEQDVNFVFMSSAEVLGAQTITNSESSLTPTFNNRIEYNDYGQRICSVLNNDFKRTFKFSRFCTKIKNQGVVNSNGLELGDDFNNVGVRREAHYTSLLRKRVYAISKTEMHKFYCRDKVGNPLSKKTSSFQDKCLDELTLASSSMGKCQRYSDEWKTFTIITKKGEHKKSQSSEDNSVCASTISKSFFIEKASETNYGFVRQRNVCNERAGLKLCGEISCSKGGQNIAQQPLYDRLNSVKHTNDKVGEAKAFTGHVKKNRCIMPPTNISLLLLASPFRWIFVGNIIRKFLHKIMRSLERQKSCCPQSEVKEINANVEQSGKPKLNTNGKTDKIQKTGFLSRETCLSSNSAANTYFSNTYKKEENGGNNLQRSCFNNDIYNLKLKRADRSNNYSASDDYDGSSREGTTHKSESSKSHKDVDDGHHDVDDDEDEEEEGAPVMATIAVTCMYIIGGSVVVANYSDNMKILDTVWFLYISMVTIGYGDITPTNEFVFICILPYIFVGLSLMSTVLNDVTSYFTNNIIRARNIGQEVQQIITTTKNVQLTVQKRERARARWDFVRSTVWKGNLPEHLVEEAKWHKINVFAKERELIRRAYSVYFYRPPCPEVVQVPETEEELEALLDSIKAKGGVSTAKAMKRIFMKKHESTIDEYMNRYFTLWHRIRRWVKRKFYELRNFVTGESIPPESPDTIKRTITLSKNEPVEVEQQVETV